MTLDDITLKLINATNEDRLSWTRKGSGWEGSGRMVNVSMSVAGYPPDIEVTIKMKESSSMGKKFLLTNSGLHCKLLHAADIQQQRKLAKALEDVEI